jgi:DnaJ-class molecular chaperone
MPIKLAPRAVVRSPLRLLQPEVDVASLSYYELLGVKRRVTPKRLRKAYRKLARVYHPDKNPACAPDGIAPGLFTEITRAYQTLSEPSSRQMYDHTRMQAKQQRAGVRRRGSASRTRTPGPSARKRKASATKKRASVHRAKSDWA